MQFTKGQLVWYMDELWEYRGMDEDGQYWLERPVQHNAFGIIEFETIDAADDEIIDSFFGENGETINQKCKRKGI